jgi:predicted transcriptional regulator
MDRSHHLGELQHAIMRVLWDEGEATVARVHEALGEQGGARALTTVATMLSKLEKKGVVAHRADGRQFVYRPLVREVDVARRMVADLTDRLFQGDVAALVSHLLREQEIDADELERLRALIEERARAGEDADAR